MVFVLRSGGSLPTAGLRVGVLGGSFNPVHGGHVAISAYAVSALRLDCILWIVCDVNPLKRGCLYDSLENRLSGIKSFVGGNIRGKRLILGVSGPYGVDTVRSLHARSKANFIWLMGDDVWLGLSRWRHWRVFRDAMPIAVFRRSHDGLAGRLPQASRRFCGVGALGVAPGRWTALRNGVFPESSTKIRGSGLFNGSPDV
jgi:nicotinate-nucleotide adenylyltransferase